MTYFKVQWYGKKSRDWEYRVGMVHVTSDGEKTLCGIGLHNPDQNLVRFWKSDSERLPEFMTPLNNCVCGKCLELAGGYPDKWLEQCSDSDDELRKLKFLDRGGRFPFWIYADVTP